MPHRSMGEMVRDQNSLTTAPDATVKEACAAMQRRRGGAVLVTDTVGLLLGIFTRRDAVRVLEIG
jgi:CBS domain-containing protein